MTQEQHQNTSQSPMLTEELPIRRCRSLSELPGHIRVPILRRQDTTRTQARLQAGAAGVQELHALREQQQQVIDKAMKAVQQKRKQPTQQRLTNTKAENHRLENKQHSEQINKQQVHSSCCPMSAWHSTNHLASISEEWISNQNDTTNKYLPGKSINSLSCSSYQENTQSNISQRQSLRNVKNNCDSVFFQAQPQHQLFDSPSDKNECNTHHNKLEENLQHNNNCQNQSQEQSFTPSTIKTEEQTSADMFKAIVNDEFSHTNCKKSPVYNDEKDNKFHKPRSRSMSHAYIQCRDSGNAPNLSDMCHNPNLHSKSGQHFSQVRSQSVSTNCAYFYDGKEKESESKLQKQSNVEDRVLHKINNSQPDSDCDMSRDTYIQHRQPKPNSIYFDQFSSTVTKNSTFESKHSYFAKKYGRPSFSYTKTSSFHQSQMFSPQLRSRNKSISWDNLLVAIGLHNESTVASDDIKDQDPKNNDDVFTNSELVSHATNENSPSLEIEGGCAVQIKKMRSQSFTSGCLLNPNYKYGILKTDYPAQCSKSGAENKEAIKIMKRHSIELHKQSAQELNSISLLRRASIQCEAVLTQAGTPKRILNPLQDVNINSLHFPGPLHAVTLQYTSVPMRNVSESCVITASRNSAKQKERDRQMSLEILSTAEVSCSATSSHTYDSLHLVNRNDSLSEPETQAVHAKLNNSKGDTSGTSNSEIVRQNIKSEQPVPRPRTSIVKAFSQTDITNVNNDATKETSDRLNETPMNLNKKSKHKENVSSEDMKSDTRQSHNSVVSDISVMNPSSPFIVAHQQHLINMKNTYSSNPVLENHGLFTKSQHKNLHKFKQNSDLNRSIADSEVTKYSSVEELKKQDLNILQEKPDLNILQVKDKKSSTILENLSIWMSSHRVYKANCHIECGAPVMKSTDESVDDSQTSPSFDCVDHLANTKLQVPKTTTNGSKSSFYSLIQKQFSPTSDVSVFSDEGYSTCDSMSQQFHLCQVCDTSKYPYSSSTASMGSLSNLPCSSQNCDGSFQTQCVPSNMKDFIHLNCMANEESRAHNSEKARDHCVTCCPARDIPNFNIQQDNTVISELVSCQYYENNSASVNCTCHHSKDKQTQQKVTEQNNQEISANKDNVTAVVDTSKDKKEDQIYICIAKPESNEHAGEEIKCVTGDTNDTAQSKVKVSAYSFKQTAV